MRVKKAFGSVIGADLSAAERKALDIEIRKVVNDYNTKNSRELDAVFLWVLHQEFGFGKERLKKFYARLIPAMQKLADHYEMDDEDQVWLCTYKLKEYGIDLEQWEKELTAD